MAKTKEIKLPLEKIVDEKQFGHCPVKALFLLYPWRILLPFKHTVAAVYEGRHVSVPYDGVLVRVGHPTFGPRNDVSEIISSSQDGRYIKYTVRMLSEEERKKVLMVTEMLHWTEY